VRNKGQKETMEQGKKERKKGREKTKKAEEQTKHSRKETCAARQLQGKLAASRKRSSCVLRKISEICIYLRMMRNTN
jgi:hypothetical protein